jgi:hypothetical protein
MDTRGENRQRQRASSLRITRIILMHYEHKKWCNTAKRILCYRNEAEKREPQLEKGEYQDVRSAKKESFNRICGNPETQVEIERRFGTNGMETWGLYTIKLFVYGVWSSEAYWTQKFAVTWEVIHTRRLKFSMMLLNPWTLGHLPKGQSLNVPTSEKKDHCHDFRMF